MIGCNVLFFLYKVSYIDQVEDKKSQNKKMESIMNNTHRCNAFPKPAALISFLGFPFRDVP